jgi:Tol biopolymer transport system component
MTESIFRGAPGGAVALCAISLLMLLLVPRTASADTCPNEEFRSGPAAGLPDCRAYEQVTPAFKEAARVEFKSSFVLSGLTGVSSNGEHVDVASVGNFGDAQASEANDSYELTRTGSGWSEANIDLPGSRFPFSEPLVTNPGLDEVLYQARTFDQPFTNNDLWLREAGGSLRDLGPFLPASVDTGPSGIGSQEIEAQFEGASADLSHVLFETKVPWPGDTTSLYEYVVGLSGPPVPVGVNPNGEQCAAHLARAENSVSADGGIVFFVIEAGGCGAGNPAVGEIFARLEGSNTVAVSEPSATDCQACDTSPGALSEANFIGASSDGSKVFFTTTQPLLGSDTSSNLYEYDFGNPPGQRLIHVSGGEWLGDKAEIADGGGGAAVSISRDGSHVYFIAQGVMRGLTDNRGQSPLVGGENLYVYERDARFPGGHTSFIATLPPEAFEEFKSRQEGYPQASATPDGRYLVFDSRGELTAGDTSTARQVFEYDAQTGNLVRVSVGQNGFNDNGNTSVFDALTPVGGSNNARAVSDDGQYVVFESADALTPQALNGLEDEFQYDEFEKHKVQVQNVYEYHDGNVYLVSDGQDTAQYEGISAVKAVGLSPSGRDIFFSTADGLVPGDVDSQLDLYDARIDGGFPAPVSLLPACSGDGCQGSLSPSPVLLAPGSEFQAGGNPPLAEPVSAHKAKSKPKAKPRPASCRRRHARKRGKCVRVKRAAKSIGGRKRNA